MTGPMYLRAAVGGLLATAALLVADAVDGPVWLRTVLAMAVFLLAPGVAVVGPASRLSLPTYWSLVIGLSISVDLLGAMLLLATDAFSASPFLVLVLVVEAAGIAVHRVLGRADRSLEEAGR